MLGKKCCIGIGIIRGGKIHCGGCRDRARFHSFSFESVPMPGCTVSFSSIWMRDWHCLLLFPAVPEGQCACCPESERHGRELPQGMLGCAERGEKRQLSHRRYIILSYAEGEEPAFISPAQKVGDFRSFVLFMIGVKQGDSGQRSKPARLTN